MSGVVARGAGCVAGALIGYPVSFLLAQEIDDKESVALSDPQPSGLHVREDAPSYTFYRHERGAPAPSSLPALILGEPAP